MATRSTIGYETADGGYVGVYCHYDGFPDHMGPILHEMLHADVVIMVSKALHGGGLRCVMDGGVYEIFTDRNGITPPDRVALLPRGVRLPQVPRRTGGVDGLRCRPGMASPGVSVQPAGDRGITGKSRGGTNANPSQPQLHAHGHPGR